MLGGRAENCLPPSYTPASANAGNPSTERDAGDPDASVWTTSPDGTLIPDYDATIPVINEGRSSAATVVRVDKDEVLVDVGYKSEGVIPVSELSIRRSINALDEVKLGDEIDALVMTMEDADGRLILSKKRARFEMAWKRIEVASESGEPVDGNVIEVVKGGLILDLGVRGFLPASLVDIRRVQHLEKFLGRTLSCKVIELNRSRNNVVLSRRAVLEEERKEARQAILDRLSPGDVVDGAISNIVDFGAFVDLNGIDGLIHISELSWSHVNHPSEILEIGQTVTVKVLDIDRERQRISLGLKQTQADPWQQVIDAYDEFDVVEGRVTKVVTFGAFVEILPGVEGLVHISELAPHHVETPREIVAQGDDVQVKIIEMDADRRRLSLSIKRVEPGDPVQPRIGPPTPIPPEKPAESDAPAPEVAPAEVAPAADADEETVAADGADAAPAPEQPPVPEQPDRPEPPGHDAAAAAEEAEPASEPPGTGDSEPERQPSPEAPAPESAVGAEPRAPDAQQGSATPAEPAPAAAGQASSDPASDAPAEPAVDVEAKPAADASADAAGAPEEPASGVSGSGPPG